MGSCKSSHVVVLAISSCCNLSLPSDFDPSSMFTTMFGGFDGMGFGGMGGGRRGHTFSFTTGGPEFTFQFS